VAAREEIDYAQVGSKTRGSLHITSLLAAGAFSSVVRVQEDAETTYFNESVDTAKGAVAEAFAAYDTVLKVWRALTVCQQCAVRHGSRTARAPAGLVGRRAWQAATRHGSENGAAQGNAHAACWCCVMLWVCIVPPHARHAWQAELAQLDHLHA